MLVKSLVLLRYIVQEREGNREGSEGVRERERVTERITLTGLAWLFGLLVMLCSLKAVSVRVPLPALTLILTLVTLVTLVTVMLPLVLVLRLLFQVKEELRCWLLL